MNELDENESEDDEDTEWGLEDDFNRNAFGDFIIDVNSRTEHYVISFISKFNLLFLVYLLQCLRRKMKKKIKFLTYCLDKNIKNLVVRKIKFVQKFLKCLDQEIKFSQKLTNFATREIKFPQKKMFLANREIKFPRKFLPLRYDIILMAKLFIL